MHFFFVRVVEKFKPKLHRIISGQYCYRSIYVALEDIMKLHSSFSASQKLGMIRICTKLCQIPRNCLDIAMTLVSRTLMQSFSQKLVVSYPSYSFQMLVVIHKTRKRTHPDIYLEDHTSNYISLSACCD